MYKSLTSLIICKIRIRVISGHRDRKNHFFKRALKTLNMNLKSTLNGKSKIIYFFFSVVVYQGDV